MEQVTTQETQFERYCRLAKEIQSKCCCHEFHERDCYRSRYPRPIDDSFNEDEWEDDNVCECACHAELGVIERDIWPDEEL